VQRALGTIVLVLLGVSASACSALTQPEEILISAEPMPSPNPAPAPAMAERPAGLQMPAAGGAQKGG
jgi:hypothetical protein